MSRKLIVAFVVCLFGFVTIFVTEARADTDPKLIGDYGSWSAYSLVESGNKVCYMVSEPEKHEGNYARRGDIYALITHRPAEGTKNVFSYIAGYPYKPGSDATLNVGNQRFSLFTQDETAWAPDVETDNKIADAIKRGSKLIVKGTSSRGTLTTDTYSLSGSSAAFEAITKECN